MTQRQANAPTGPSGSHPGGHAAEIVRSVEGIVEHAVEAAEQSLGQRLGEGGMRLLLWGISALGWLLLAAYFVFCISLISLRSDLLPDAHNDSAPADNRPLAPESSCSAPETDGHSSDAAD